MYQECNVGFHTRIYCYQIRYIINVSLNKINDLDVEDKKLLILQIDDKGQNL